MVLGIYVRDRFKCICGRKVGGGKGGEGDNPCKICLTDHGSVYTLVLNSCSSLAIFSLVIPYFPLNF